MVHNYDDFAVDLIFIQADKWKKEQEMLLDILKKDPVDIQIVYPEKQQHDTADTVIHLPF